jgi:site-specific DNA-methyltransferase (adenine-specific)
VDNPVIIGDCTLYLGDCLDIMPTLGKVDAVVTDPPYGVDYKYESYDDTSARTGELLKRAIPIIKKISPASMFNGGVLTLKHYTDYNWVALWIEKAGTGISPFGFTCWQPILFYGKDPYLSKGLGSRPDVFWGTGEGASNKQHPCAKPLGVVRWMIQRLTPPPGSQLVLDPFMGSGTTGVACVQLGRKFIGIEIEPKYFDIACKRIDQAQRQGQLFSPKNPDTEQLDIGT